MRTVLAIVLVVFAVGCAERKWPTGTVVDRGRYGWGGSYVTVRDSNGVVHDIQCGELARKIEIGSQFPPGK